MVQKIKVGLDRAIRSLLLMITKEYRERKEGKNNWTFVMTPIKKRVPLPFLCFSFIEFFVFFFPVNYMA